MPRGGIWRGGYGRGGYRVGPHSLGGFYTLLDLLILIGILYFLIKLFLVALPYALGLTVLLVLRAFLRGPGFHRFF